MVSGYLFVLEACCQWELGSLCDFQVNEERRGLARSCELVIQGE